MILVYGHVSVCLRDDIILWAGLYVVMLWYDAMVVFVYDYGIMILCMYVVVILVGEWYSSRC